MCACLLALCGRCGRPRSFAAGVGSGRVRLTMGRVLGVSVVARGAGFRHPAGFEILPSPEAMALFAEDSGDWTYLDVRNLEELAAVGRPAVPRYVNVPSHSPMFDAAAFLRAVEQQISSKNAGVVVGCAAGVRSKAAAEALARAGYLKVKEVADGFSGWAGNGLPVTSSMPLTAEDQRQLDELMSMGMDEEEARVTLGLPPNRRS